MSPAAVRGADAVPSMDEIRGKPVVARGNAAPVVEIGLDLSSSAIGWAVSVDQLLYNHGKLVFRRTDGMGAKVRDAYEFFWDLFRFYKPTRICLEKPVMRHGSSTARHNEMLAVVRLAAISAGAGEIADEAMIPPQTIKRCLKVPKGDSHEENKRNMLELVNQRLGLRLKFHKGSKLESDDDIADAIAVLMTLWVLDVERAAPAPHKRSNKKKRAA
jgi:Holliday junction resolvasome RuvABC endonuclease subunit